MSSPSPTMTRARLRPRAAAEEIRLSWPALTWFVGAHLVTFGLIGVTASWTVYFLAFFLHSIFGVSITLAAHRYFSHGTFQAPRWLENTLAVLYTLSFDRCGEGLLSWVAGHKFHHAYPDQKYDPHSPIVGGFWHAYCGHYLWRRRDLYDFNEYKHYVPTLARRPFLVWLDRPATIWSLQLAFASLIFLLGGWIGAAPGFDWTSGLAFVVWGIFGRYVFTQFSHSMVDTISHGVGIFRRLPDTCRTGTEAKNNLAYWFCTFGSETWHNIHHAFPRAATSGERWYRWDLDSFLMTTWERLGLVSGLHHLTEEEIARRTSPEPRSDAALRRDF